MHPEDKNNLFLFMLLATLIYLGFDHFIMQPRMEEMKASQQAEAVKKQEEFEARREVDDIEPLAGLSRQNVLAKEPRIKISNNQVSGSLSLKGSRIDDLKLLNHYVTLDRERKVSVLTPAGVKGARFAEYGWVPANKNIRVPDRNTPWELKKGSNSELTPEKPVILRWENGQGLIFERELEIDQNFLITIEDKIINETDKTLTFYPYGLVSQRGVPEDFTGQWVIHEGPIAYIGEELMEISYEELNDKGTKESYDDRGWIGFTEKYWFVSILPAQVGQKTFRFIQKAAEKSDNPPLYQVDMLGQSMTVNPGETGGYTNRLFAGAKRVKLLAHYEKTLDVPHFDLAVDFGMWYFLTKPFLYLLIFINGLVGNFGITIIIFTLMLRLAVFPLANTSYKSFAKMRTIAPQMAEIREKYGDDKQQLQQHLVELYQRENVNPMAGCLPILVQIPIFFSLYKVLRLSIEMRHAPFFGWIQDMSAPDPTTIFNLFGLIDWQPPEPLMIGAWPCMMLATMLLQRSMQPPPQDRTQAMMIRFMPWFMTYILSKFAAGLVIYWTFSSALALVQQYIIMRSMGVEVKFFQKSGTEQAMEKKVMEGPGVHPGVEVAEEKIEEAMFGEQEEQDKPKEIKPPRPKKKKKKK